MNFEPYVYTLPDDRIAQRPVHPPEAAKMMIVDRGAGELRHSAFADIADCLRPTDHLIFNNTKVIPARLFGTLGDAGGYPVEIVLLRELAKNEWSAIGYPMRRIRNASIVYFSDALVAEVLPSPSDDRLRLRFSTPTNRAPFDLIHEHGTMPIPPYIRDGRGDEQDRVDYQSIFAQNPGSVAAPTASLHFSESLLASIRERVGCRVDTLTLHVGAASFQPIVVNGELRPPGEEHFHVPAELLESIRETKARGGRVVAVGTTVVRALESAARVEQGQERGETTLFIQPGFQFQLVDALVTNFHQPATTHLLLVEALIGKRLLDSAYQTALSSQYRFLSYGDGMLII
jgi:S-adenosylmethionine:tRNA ribosyltransferase-isomerase